MVRMSDSIPTSYINLFGKCDEKVEVPKEAAKTNSQPKGPTTIKVSRHDLPPIHTSVQVEGDYA